MAKKETSPAYLWYPKDVMSSGRVAALTALEELWYRRALDQSWLHVGMPGDPEEFAGWVGRGCTAESAAKIIDRFFDFRVRNSEKVFNKKQEELRKGFEKKRKKNSQAGIESGRKRRERSKLGAEQTFNERCNETRTKSNSSFPYSFPLSEEREEAPPPPLSPALVVYEETFGPAGSAFASSIAATVTDLGLWVDLVREKSAYGDDPEKRRNVPKWILGEYAKRIADRRPPKPPEPGTRIKTAREFAREAVEQMGAVH